MWECWGREITVTRKGLQTQNLPALWKPDEWKLGSLPRFLAQAQQSQQPAILTVWWPLNPVSLAAGIAWTLLENILSHLDFQKIKQVQCCLRCASERDQGKARKFALPLPRRDPAFGLKGRITQLLLLLLTSIKLNQKNSKVNAQDTKGAAVTEKMRICSGD